MLVLDGTRVFPVVLSNPPPLNGKAPNGRNGLAEVAAGGVNFIRTGRNDWNLPAIDSQLAEEKTVLDTAHAHGLHCWLWLGNVTDLPAAAPGQPPSKEEQLLTKIADGLQGHAALGAYKGVDEPANPFRNPVIPPAGLVRGYRHLKSVDPSHPLVIIQAPLGTVTQLTPYRPAFDVTGADAYPVSYPPGTHTETANHDISVVGDITRKMVKAAGPKPVWMTLQIAWSGVSPSRQHPAIVPRLPDPGGRTIHGVPGRRGRGARARLLRRPPHPDCRARRRRRRLELDVLGAGAASAARRAHLSRAARRRSSQQTRRRRSPPARAPWSSLPGRTRRTST